MKIKPYVEKLSGSSEFKHFRKENPDAFMIAGFFIIDFDDGKNTHQIDYYVPSTKKVAAFTLDNKIIVQMLELMSKKVPEKLDLETNIDLEALHGILEDEMKNRSITETIKKIIAIIQTIEGKKLWNVNCMLSGMGLLRAHVDDESKTILKMEKLSILDFVKKVSAPQLAQMQKAQQAQQVPQEQTAGKAKKPMTKEQVKQQIENLNKLEQAVEDEKKILEKSLGKETVQEKVNKALANSAEKPVSKKTKK